MRAPTVGCPVFFRVKTSESGILKRRPSGWRFPFVRSVYACLINCEPLRRRWSGWQSLAPNFFRILSAPIGAMEHLIHLIHLSRNRRIFCALRLRDSGVQHRAGDFRAILVYRGVSCIGLLTRPVQKSAAHEAASSVNWCSRLLKMTIPKTN